MGSSSWALRPAGASCPVLSCLVLSYPVLSLVLSLLLDDVPKFIFGSDVAANDDDDDVANSRRLHLV